VKAANKAVAALMSTPWSMPAAKALATATAAQTISWIGMVAQAATTIGQVLSGVQQATHKTDTTMATLGQVLGAGTGTPPSAATPPTFPPPTQQPTVSANPSVQAPGVTPPMGYSPMPGNPPQRGLPTVYESGWIPRGASPGTGNGLTIDVTDSDHDGRYEVRLNVPESQLTKDLKINVAAKVGDQEIKGNFEIDV
jgi:hypothetical protein